MGKSSESCCRSKDHRGKEKTKMTDEQRKDEKEFQNFCQGMPFTDMMKKMMGAEKGGLPCNCTEMMSRMKKMCCGSWEKKEGSSQETKENPAPNL
jgi:hypothetical protein